MNALRSQNCRDQPLILLGAASALFFIVYFATESPDFAAREWWGLAVTSVFGILGGGWLLGKVSGLVFAATGSRLVVDRPGGAINILYQNISRIDRIRRVPGKSSETVRITFRRVGRSHAVELRPECPEALVWDILQHCPQLTRYRDSKVVRNRSFGTAEDQLEESSRPVSPHLGKEDVF